MRIILSQEVLSPFALPKPKDFLGTDADWSTLQQMIKPEPPQSAPVPVPVPVPEPTPITTPVEQIHEPVVEEPITEEPEDKTETSPEGPYEIPEWLGKEIEKEETKGQEDPILKDVLPLDDPTNDEVVPTGISREGPPSEYQEYLEDEGIQKITPKKDVEPVDPAKMFQEVLPADTPIEERNKQMDVRQKIWYAMSNDNKIRINYDTLDKKDKPSLNVTRLVLPQYVAFHNGTNQFFLYTKPDPLKKADYGPIDPSNADGWKSFAIENIRSAKLEE